jgi:hypothetical protein
MENLESLTPNGLKVSILTEALSRHDCWSNPAPTFDSQEDQSLTTKPVSRL